MAVVARFGVAACALGLSLAGPQSLAVAVADDGAADATTTSDHSGPETAPQPSRAARPARAHPVGTAERAPRAPADSSPDSTDVVAAQRGSAEPVPPVSRPRRAGASSAVDAGRSAEPVTETETHSARVVTPPAVNAFPAASVFPRSSAVPADSVVPADSEVPAVVPAPTPAAIAQFRARPAVPAVSVPATPAVTALHTLSNLIGILSGGLAGHGPGAPAGNPLSWSVLAAATRQTFGAAAAAESTGDVATTTAPATPAVPLFTSLHLQQIPVVGPLLVTPVVNVVNQIPIIGDILHPIFGYPVQPEGTVAPRDVRVRSFDSTEISVHFMPAAGLTPGQNAPTILMGPGLPMPGQTNINGTPLDGLLSDFIGMTSIATLRKAGYNVVTWDPRGEYFSGGQLELDSPEFEGRDVSSIINWVATQPEVQLDGTGDPRMGMVGVSYGGGIQLVAAAADHRIDAIVPTVEWNTLNSSLYRNGAFKNGWGTLLEAAVTVTLARVNPRVLPSVVYGDFTGDMNAADQDLLAQRGPGSVAGYPDLVNQITAPTLLIQGTVDTLFTLSEASATAASLMAHGVPTSVLWFCGGHGLCVNNPNDLSDGVLVEQRTMQWLDRYVKGDPVSTGPGFEWVDQRGQRFSTADFQPGNGTPIVVSRDTRAVLPLIPYVGGSSPLLFVAPIGGSKALNAINLVTPASTTTSYVVGEPKVTFTYSGTGSGDHVYAQLVDNSTGLVLGNQVTPIPVTLDGKTHTVSVALQSVAATLRPGDTVTLQLVSWSADYAAGPAVGELTVSNLNVVLPTADPALVSQGSQFSTAI